MSITKTPLEQTGLLAPSSKDADLATSHSQRRPRLFSRLQPALHLNLSPKSSTTLSDHRTTTGNIPISLPSNQQRHPQTNFHHSSKQFPTRLPSNTQTTTQIAAPPSTRIPYSEFQRDYGDDYGDTDLESLPAGFPYTSWYGAWCFACEYVRSMQALVTERMEGSGKYGTVRRTT